MDITRTTIWKALADHAKTMGSRRITDLFNEDPGRAERMSVEAAGIQLDFSKNLLDETTLSLLSTLADEANISAEAQRMYEGEPVNVTEQRAALHTLLRAADHDVGGGLQDEITRVRTTLERMETIAGDIREGRWTGHAGKPIRSVIHLGIGGSYLGPRMVAEALGASTDGNIEARYVANVDGQHLHGVLAELDPDETLIVIASKTFTTAETMANARTARQWLANKVPEDAMDRHLIAITGNGAAATGFGVGASNVLPIADWVGGRYSLWSSVGITLAITHGFECFRQLLAGARAMDRHFLEAPVRENIPALLGLIGVWYHNFFGAESHAIIPYDHLLRLLPAHLQQLDMESNGKGVTLEGEPVNCTTGPIVWGGEGTNGQHAFHQLLHQGKHLVGIDFILPLTSSQPWRQHQDLLVANCLSQSQALMTGQEAQSIVEELLDSGMTRAEAEALAPHRTMPGNRPSNTIIVDAVTPATLGALIAMYEHKVFCQARIWHINPFDQWGVELGKRLATAIQAQFDNHGDESQQDPSTHRLIELYKSRRI